MVEKLSCLSFGLYFPKIQKSIHLYLCSGQFNCLNGYFYICWCEYLSLRFDFYFNLFYSLINRLIFFLLLGGQSKLSYCNLGKLLITQSYLSFLNNLENFYRCLTFSGFVGFHLQDTTSKTFFSILYFIINGFFIDFTFAQFNLI